MIMKLEIANYFIIIFYVDAIDDDCADSWIEVAAGSCENIGRKEEDSVDTRQLLTKHEADSHQKRFGCPPAEYFRKFCVFCILSLCGSYQLGQFFVDVVVRSSQPHQRFLGIRLPI